MSLTVAIIANVLADIALIAGLAYLMSRTTRLTPHVGAGSPTNAVARSGKRPSPSRHSARRSPALTLAHAERSD
jgi:hypothetical protein